MTITSASSKESELAKQTKVASVHDINIIRETTKGEKGKKKQDFTRSCILDLKQPLMHDSIESSGQILEILNHLFSIICLRHKFRHTNKFNN